MIEYIHLHNFQKHEDKRVEFNPQVNYISGQNGCGKSTILRAITWVSMNEGSSQSYRRTFMENGKLKTSSETSVEIGVDGHIVERVLSNTKNEYYVDGEKLTGFGRGVPTAVSKLFSMSSLNVSKQFAPLFLVDGSSGGTIASELAQIASMEEMEILTDAINTDIREQSTKVDFIETHLTSSKDAYKMLSDKISELYEVCIDEVEIHKKRKHMIDSCRTLLKEVVEDTTPLDKLVQEFDLVCPDVSLFQREDLSEIRMLIKNTETPIPDVLPLDCGIDPSDFNEESYDWLRECCDSIEEWSNQESKYASELLTLEKELDTFDVCPTCGRVL